MSDQIITSIDLGSSAVRCVVAERVTDGQEQRLKIRGVGAAVSRGVRRGSVVDVGDAAQAIVEAVEAAELMSGLQIHSAIVSVGGSGVRVESSQGVVAIGRADGEVTDDDVARVINAAQAITVPANHDIMHVIPRAFRLDEQPPVKDPVGMHGVRLELDAIIVEAPTANMKNLTQAFQQAEIAVEDFIIEPLAVAEAVLTKRQKELGVAVVNLGASTTSIAVFEEGEVLHVNVLPVGVDHITHDIAIGLRTSVEIAEQIKLQYGTADIASVSKRTMIELQAFSPEEQDSVSHYHVIEIIAARLEEIFEMVHKDLEAIGKAQLLPAGIVLTGGGASMPFVVDFAKEALRLPISIGVPHNLSGMLDLVDQPSYSTALGLMTWAEDHHGGVRNGLVARLGGLRGTAGSLGQHMKTGLGSVGTFLRRLMP